MRIPCGKVEDTEAGLRYAYGIKIVVYLVIALLLAILYYRFYYPLKGTNLF